MDNQISMKIKKGRIIALLLSIIFCIQLENSNLYGQINRGKRKANFSSTGRSKSTIRHGITLQLIDNLSAKPKQMDFVPAFGIGYSAGQYYGIGNRFMQQSVTYQLGIGTSENYMVHNLVGTFHCSYIGAFDMNPVIYGVAMQFAFSTKSSKNPNPYGNLYIRPEIGLAYPFNYSKRTKEVLRVTGSLTYGFNIKTFYYHYIPEQEIESIESKFPWAAMCHHVITFRMNINCKNMREMRK